MTCMHNIPGRLRVRIPAIKGSPNKARATQALLMDLEGIESIRANMVTGSIVVKYDPGRFLSQRILSILKENGCFDGTKAFTMNRAMPHAPSKAGKAISKAFCGWAVGRALEGTGFSFLAVLI